MSHRADPRRLDNRWDTRDDRVEDPRFLTREDCQDLLTRIRKFTSPVHNNRADVVSSWMGSVRWARNETVVASDRRETTLKLTCGAPLGKGAEVQLNQTDDASLRAAIAWVERLWYVNGGTPYGRYEEPDPWIPQPLLDTPIWSETTYQQTPEQRNEVAHTLLTAAQKAGMLSAGYLAVEGRSTALGNPGSELLYGRQTIAQCSLTVRDPEGSGSGWAGASSYDWARFDPQKLGEIALDKCLRSRHPVAIEPGRYTVILEPQATHSLMSLIAGNLYMDASLLPPLIFYDRSEKILLDARLANAKKDPGRAWIGVPFTKIGQKILDDRVTIRQEPTHPDTGMLPFSKYSGDAYRPQTWIEKGVLVKLGYSDGAAKSLYHENGGSAIDYDGIFTMSGGTTSVEEMIKSTQRGLLVTRFWGMVTYNATTLLSTGVTRDGLWLIEGGVITKAVKNLRFTESPLFAFNQIEALGVPVPVFSPGKPAVVPPVKIKDFSFTSLIDAV